MKITFTKNKEDFQALSQYIRRRVCRISGANTLIFFSQILIYFFLGLGVMMVFDMYQHHKHGADARILQIGLGALIVTGILYQAVPYWLNRRYSAAFLKDQGIGISTYEVELTENGIIERTAVSEMLTKWEGIQRVEMDTKHIGLLIDNASYIWIPKQAFTSEDEIQGFLSSVHSHCPLQRTE
jgi:hypothetical protein